MPTRADLLARYGDELRGLLMDSFGRKFAALLHKAKDTPEYHAAVGRAMEEQIDRGRRFLERLVDELLPREASGGNSEPNGTGHAGGGNGKAPAADKPGLAGPQQVREGRRGPDL